MIVVVNWLLLGLMVGVYFLGVLLALWPTRPTSGPRTGTRIMLVLLRLAIAWHFFIEGMDKLHQASWTSEGYLREATGPLAPNFRELAGDRLVDRLTLTHDRGFPDELDSEWTDYLTAFQRYYDLDEEQSKRTVESLRQLKKDLGSFLATRKKLVEKPSPYPPPLKEQLTVTERIEEYRKAREKAEEIEAKLLLEYGSEEVERWRTAKGDANKWRGGLQKDLAFLNKEMKRALQNVLLSIAAEKLPDESQKGIQAGLNKITKDAEKDVAGISPDNWDDLDRSREKWAEKTAELYRLAFREQDMKDAKAAESRDRQTKRILDSVLEKPGKDRPGIEPLPFPVSRRLSSWSLLDWSDRLVKYGITTVGILLLIGLFTRTACVAGAGFLLMFYLAMPPLPGWPESPRVEGHYLFINKNIIEMLALLTLATTHSGRWAGLDALIHLLLPFRRQPTPVRMETSTQSTLALTINEQAPKNKTITSFQ